MMRIKEYPPDLIVAAKTFLDNRTLAHGQVLLGMIHYLSRDIIYTEAFFDGLASKHYMVPKHCGFFQRRKHKKAFKDGYIFRSFVLKRK